MSNTKGLGRGFDSLIPTEVNSDMWRSEKDRIKKVLVSDIKPNPNQPRKNFDEILLTELSQSIQKFGVLQPLIVVRNGENYLLVAGERRWRAAKLAGLAELPVIIRTDEELEQLEISLIENVQRVDLSPIEQAISIARLREQFNMSFEDIASRLGKAVPTINNIVRLLQLPKSSREALDNSLISEGHARAILSLKSDEKLQNFLLAKILKESWSVRQAEQFVISAKKQTDSKQIVSKKMVYSETNDTKKLSKKYGTSVKVQITAKGGRLIFEYKNDSELQDLVKKLG